MDGWVVCGVVGWFGEGLLGFCAESAPIVGALSLLTVIALRFVGVPSWILYHV